MQPLDALTMSHFASELDLKLSCGKINKIQQPSHYELLLHLFVGGEKGRQKLYINILPAFAFCALLDESQFLQIPDKAANLCMILRKHLTSARILNIKALPDERVIHIALDNFNELGQQVRFVLSLELMGKNSNIILFDADDKSILGCAHGVSEQMSRFREISVGYPYVPPPPPPHKLLRELSESEFVDLIQQARATDTDPATLLTQNFSGFGRATLRDLIERVPDPAEAYRTLQEMLAGRQLHPAISEDWSTYSLLPQHAQDAGWRGYPSISAMVTDFSHHHYLGFLMQERRQQLTALLKQQEKKALKWRKEAEKSDPEAIAALRKAGDLLTLAVSQRQDIPPGTTRITLTDYETNQPLTLELDPHLDLGENAQLYYKRYKKGQTRQKMAEASQAQLNQQMAYLAELYHAVDTADSLEELAALKQEMVSQGWVKATPTPGKKAAPVDPQLLSVVSRDGFTILIGKTGMQNERLVGKLAQPEDIWLHAHLIPGSHVLIKTQKQDVPNETLLEAAQLAAYFSKARLSVNVPVVFTHARYVRKIPDSYPGHVNYTHEQAINVDPMSPEQLAAQRPLAEPVAGAGEPG